MARARHVWRGSNNRLGRVLGHYSITSGPSISHGRASRSWRQTPKKIAVSPIGKSPTRSREPSTGSDEPGIDPA